MWHFSLHDIIKKKVRAHPSLSLTPSKVTGSLLLGEREWAISDHVKIKIWLGHTSYNKAFVLSCGDIIMCFPVEGESSFWPHFYYLMLIKGGYTTGPKQLIQLLRQKSRPYLFSNTLPPPVVGGASKVSWVFSTNLFDGVLYLTKACCLTYKLVLFSPSLVTQ